VRVGIAIAPERSLVKIDEAAAQPWSARHQ
jgi:hypothetical protein